MNSGCVKCVKYESSEAFMEKLIHFLRGYVKIKVWGYSPERFMNLCGNRNILLWNIENHGSYNTVCISISGFRQLRTITKKTKTRVVILEKKGLPFLLPHMRKRSIFLIGLLGCLLFLHGMSNYIWTIEIVGNRSVTTDVLMDFLAENEIVCGSKKKTLEIEQLEKAIRERFDIVTWTSARLDGTKLYIQIKENQKAPPRIEEKDGTGMDLQATKEGTVVSIVTRSGVPLVKAKDQIEPGDILVSGAVPIYGEDTLVKEYQFCRADADIYLQCGRHYEEKLPVSYQYKVYSGEEIKAPYVRIFENELRLPIPKNTFARSDCIISENRIEPLPDFYLPVVFGSYRYREYELTEKKYTPEQAKTLCAEKLSQIIETLQEKGVQIIRKNVKIEKDSAHYIMRADFTVVEKTGTLVRTKAEAPETDEMKEAKEQ